MARSKFWRKKMINFIEEWICDGCGNIFDKTELVFVNPHNYTVKMELNGLKHRLSPYEVKVIELKDDIATIRGQSYFLRPIVFNYLNGRIDVYHT